MDLLDFQAESLYFDDPCPAEVDDALQSAALNYGRPSAESSLYRAYFLAPDNLSVLVALYRYFYYQHRFEDGLRVAERAMNVSAQRLGINPDWRQLNIQDLACGVRQSMGLVRFHLFALKAAGLLKLRLGDAEGALACLSKVSELDIADRIGADSLLVMARQAVGQAHPGRAQAGGIN